MSRLLDDMGFKRLTAEEESYLNDVAADTIFNRVIERVGNLLEDVEFATIRNLFEQGSETDIVAFLEANNLDLDTLVNEEEKKYRQEMIDAKELLAKNNG